jgi:hypothetical protein
MAIMKRIIEGRLAPEATNKSTSNVTDGAPAQNGVVVRKKSKPNKRSAMSGNAPIRSRKKIGSRKTT